MSKLKNMLPPDGLLEDLAGPGEGAELGLSNESFSYPSCRQVGVLVSGGKKRWRKVD